MYYLSLWIKFSQHWEIETNIRNKLDTKIGIKLQMHPWSWPWTHNVYAVENSLIVQSNWLYKKQMLYEYIYKAHLPIK